jgi:hypothetical protein
MVVRAGVLLGLALLSTVMVIGCSTAPEAPGPKAAASEPALTTEAAKQALLARMNSDRLFGFKADVWSKVDVGESHDGWHDFGGNFSINPSARKYTARYGPPPEVKGCTFEFEGTFSFRDGVWVADDPVEVRSALGGGK